jgi:hypothetical protein
VDVKQPCSVSASTHNLRDPLLRNLESLSEIANGFTLAISHTDFLIFRVSFVRVWSVREARGVFRPIYEQHSVLSAATGCCNPLGATLSRVGIFVTDHTSLKFAREQLALNPSKALGLLELLVSVPLK